jgi:hypothetical protein
MSDFKGKISTQARNGVACAGRRRRGKSRTYAGGHACSHHHKPVPKYRAHTKHAAGSVRDDIVKRRHGSREALPQVGPYRRRRD